MENSSTSGVKFCEIAKLTVIGSVFVGVGAVLNSYVPAFHAPVRWVDVALRRTGQGVSSLPFAGGLIENNPLATNNKLREFLAVNIVESAMIGGMLVGGGAVMKLAGVKPRTIEQWLSSNHGDHGR